MPDISLHTYITNPVEKLSGVNVPHKYRVAKKKGYKYLLEDYLKFWDKSKQAVLEKLVSAIISKINTNEGFAMAVAPSNTPPFNTNIHGYLINSFSNAIDITNCFSKNANFESIIQNGLLSDEQLRTQFYLDTEEVNKCISNEIKTILLVDDVFSFGNTLRGMELLIRDILPDIEIIKAVLLKTT